MPYELNTKSPLAPVFRTSSFEVRRWVWSYSEVVCAGWWWHRLSVILKLLFGVLLRKNNFAVFIQLRRYSLCISQVTRQCNYSPPQQIYLPSGKQGRKRYHKRKKRKMERLLQGWTSSVWQGKGRRHQFWTFILHHKLFCFACCPWHCNINGLGSFTLDPQEPGG